MTRRLRMGMVGGGPGSFIGPIHRIAAELDREIELVAGAFASDAARSREAAQGYRIDPDRGYPDFMAMLEAEAARPDGIDFVSVVTPNHVHLPVVKAALDAGIPVICDKPATATLEEAVELAQIVKRTGVPYRLTYTYTGYPLVREARARVERGDLGTIRKIVVEYPQGWLAQPSDGKQAAWRGDPTKAGEGGCVADIGVHAFHMAEFVTGLKVTEILADLGTVVEGRVLDDDCAMLLRFDNRARGILSASQIETGELNGIRLRIYGDRGGLIWRHDDPNTLIILGENGDNRLVRAGDPDLGADALAATRIGGGHPEGYLEAFANLYLDFAAAVRGEAAPLLPGVADGLRGMALIRAAVRSSTAGGRWTSLSIEELLS